MGYAVADQVVFSFGNMITAALVSRHCAQREFGMYILTQRSMDVLNQLSNVFLWAPFTFNLPGTEEGRRARYQGSMLQLQVLFCAAATAIFWLAARWAAHPERGIYYGTFAPLILTGSGLIFREFTRRMYFAHLRMKEAFWTDCATVLLQIAGVEWLYKMGRLNVGNTLLVLSAGAVVVSLWWLVREVRECTFSTFAVATDLRQNLQLGRWFLGSNMVFLASSQCNPWVLSALLGGASVGAYTVCESVVNIPRVALTSMQNIMGPMIARAHHEDGTAGLQTVVQKLDRTLLIGSSFFAIMIVLIGPWIAHLIFKTVPGNARTVLLLLCLNLVAFAATLAQSFGLSALNRADTTLYANVIGLGIQAAVCLALVRAFGMPGVAAAMLIGSLVATFVRAAFYRRATRVSQLPVRLSV